ncbi:hypothetical protein ACFOHT_22160 [Massilia oculi]|uniref:hypothetical protein n=1 Tax=Massilia oculi TaxID=945844 RepID=UPI0013B3B768|nr:hypothetical protein [Massilia oculi]
MMMSFFFEPVGAAGAAASAFGSAFIFGFAFKISLQCQVNGIQHYGIVAERCTPASLEKREEEAVNPELLQARDDGK